MRPTAPDRERLASGIELAQHLADAVKEAQQQVLDRHLGTVKQQERKFFEDMQSQKKYEQVCGHGLEWQCRVNAGWEGCLAGHGRSSSRAKICANLSLKALPPGLQ